MNTECKAGMKSIREIYKIGCGPSSSHTIGPERTARFFKEKNRAADFFRVVLYGSLALTGKGHRTDYVLGKVFASVKFEIIFDTEKSDIPHPNTFEISAYKKGVMLDSVCFMSTGGGTIEVYGEGQDSLLTDEKLPDIYTLSKYKDISLFCGENKLRLWQYVMMCEDDSIYGYLKNVWHTMKDCIESGLNSSGFICGGLNLQRKAKYLYNRHHIDETQETKEMRLICAYAYAVSEQNASGEKIVTAPTCGSAGVLPAVLLYEQDRFGFTDDQIIHALATAGIIGNLIKTNASISGAECGCQAEIGSACSMAAAALGELYDLSLDEIEYAAEIAMEHHLGLTCDPVRGLVQIPCIERNAIAAMRALNAFKLSSFLSSTRKISFDLVIKTMYETGKDMSQRYRETSEGGLAALYNENETE